MRLCVVGGGVIGCEIDAKELEPSGLTHEPGTHASEIRHRRRRTVEDGGPGDEHVGTRLGNLLDVVHLACVGCRGSHA